MTGKLKLPRARSKTRTRTNEGRNRSIRRSIHPAMRVFKELFPQKPAFELALLTGASLSFCEKVLSGAHQPGPDMLVALLQSDVGREILIALMADAKPAWWKGFRRHLELAELVKNQARLGASIEKMQREMAE